ncbi:hypothetical protein CHGG_06574 [Chaetomium globosum CBS 148.51]|uniref:Kinetochore protein Sos7 coiled-coil domain-containing protein n=1 Tax=Chaetomium globosum (strain ATCC 6205 / CBS 148.51 / DSM 1962 / NBRC 6347 / NRRL 1970) TaxID=306901 RepID=Q2H441_CHAGB|nr:uncharacterized protein CHGG_06574 [Chaetomium globosum CBS 148.51]EAQ89955.1 hypothetical protein CHGG_06574 [Chaetomium globosum CBS 148.51]
MLLPTSSPNKPDQQRAAKVLRALDDLQSASGDGSDAYTIIKLSEPIFSSSSNNNPNSNPTTTTAAAPTTLARTSDVSTASLDAPTPTSLEADLAHYRELFSKLRFSYVEQVTKEKFIRAIVGDPPQIVSPQENADLEAANADAKAALKALKTEVAAMVADLEARGRALTARYEAVQEELGVLRALPAEIDGLEERVRDLRAQHQLLRAAGGGARDEHAVGEDEGVGGGEEGGIKGVGEGGGSGGGAGAEEEEGAGAVEGGGGRAGESEGE